MEEFTTGKVSCYHHCLFFPEKKSKQSVARNLNPFILLTANCRFVFECNFVKKKLIEEYTIGQVSWYNHRLFSARKNPNRVQQENFTVFSSNCQFVFELQKPKRLDRRIHDRRGFMLSPLFVFSAKKSKQSAARNLNPYILPTAKLLEEYSTGQVSCDHRCLFFSREKVQTKCSKKS